MLGTTFRVTADVRGMTARQLRDAALRLDREARASMSIFEEESLLSRLNDNRTDSVDAHIAYCLRLADSVGALSGGVYDVTVKPLVEAWGFAGRAADAAPDVDSILRFVGRGKVRIEGGRLVKADPRVQLDFNSVAKGYTVDLLAALVERAGARNYLVEIGGEIRCRGVNASGGPWRIGVETPFDGNDLCGASVQRRLRMSGAGWPRRATTAATTSAPTARRWPTRSTPARGAARSRACCRSRWRRPRAPRPTRWARCTWRWGPTRRSNACAPMRRPGSISSSRRPTGATRSTSRPRWRRCCWIERPGAVRSGGARRNQYEKGDIPI